MKASILVKLVFFSCMFLACHKKDKEPLPEPEPAPAPTSPSEIPDCQSLPPDPKPFGWHDSTLDAEKNILAFNYSPFSPDEVIYLTAGNISGFYPIYNLNVIAGTSTKLGNCGYFLPSLNKKNWMVYSSIDNNIVMLKCNGDSVTELSSDFRSINPQWDYKGNGIYYFKAANLQFASQILKMNPKTGAITVQFDAAIPQFAVYKNSEKLLYCQTSGTLATLVERDVVSEQERSLTTGPFVVKTGKVHFNNLCVDNSDQFAYWSNDLGIFRLNISNLTIDTLFKNCDNRIFDCPQISTQTGELSFTMHTRKQIAPAILFHEYKTMLSKPTANEAKVIRLFAN